MGQLNDLQIQIHENAKAKGFYDTETSFAEKIALIHSELSEALEADRKPGHKGYALEVMSPVLEIEDDNEFVKSFEEKFKNTVDDELADAVIRIMDLAEYSEIALELHILAKMRLENINTVKNIDIMGYFDQTPEEIKESNIQRCQNILSHIQGAVCGLESIYNYFDGEFYVNGNINFVDIADGETQDFEQYARGLKDDYLIQAVKDAHNKYVALLKQWRLLASGELNELLLNKKP